MYNHSSQIVLVLAALVTTSYSFAVTAAPEPTYVTELLERGIIDTWGYISGAAASPVTCPSGYTRTYDGGAANFLACCNEISCTKDWHLCVPYGGTQCPYPSICSQVYTSYTSCPQTLPGCVTYFLPTVAGQEATEGVTSYDCGAQNTEIRLATSPTGGVVASAAAQGTSNTAATTSSTVTGTGAQSTSTQSSGSPTTTTPTSGPNLSTGAIIAIAVVGAAIIGFIILVVWYCTKPWRCCGGRRREDFPDTTSTAVADPHFDATKHWALHQHHRAAHEMR